MVSRILIGLLVMTFTTVSRAQTAQVVKLEKLQEIIGVKSERIKVINFWATWCAPCVKEMPYFEKVNQERKDTEVILVSLDIDLDPDVQKVQRFVDRKKITSQVLILDEHNPDAWINKIDKSWSGALPATLVINNQSGKRIFIERSLKEGELEKVIDALKN